MITVHIQENSNKHLQTESKNIGLVNFLTKAKGTYINNAVNYNKEKSVLVVHFQI